MDLYVEYIMRNAGLDEADTGIMIAGRNIHDFGYSDDLATEQQGQIVLWYVKHKRGGRRKGGKKYKVVLEDS